MLSTIKKLNKECILLIYCSGHALKGTENWVFGCDMKSEISLKGILVESGEYKSLTIMTDCCYSGAFLKTLNGLDPLDGNEKKKNIVDDI